MLSCQNGKMQGCQGGKMQGCQDGKMQVRVIRRLGKTFSARVEVI
jgi:hypothetical protein